MRLVPAAVGDRPAARRCAPPACGWWRAAHARRRSSSPTADIACRRPYETDERRCRHAETAALAERLAPDAVAIAGDVQYDAGRLSEFRRSFDRSWGRLEIPLRPVPGNHEYRTPGAAGFFDYFEWQSRLAPAAVVRLRRRRRGG